MPISRERFDRGLNKKLDKRIDDFLKTHKGQAFTATEIAERIKGEPIECRIYLAELLRTGNISAKLVEDETYYSAKSEG